MKKYLSKRGGSLIGKLLITVMVSIVLMIGCRSVPCEPKTNWSGYWWPQKTNPGCNLYSSGGPAEKYDKYVVATTGTNPGWQQWEKIYHDDGPGVAGWWGHCHALASASILELEPCKTMKKAGITFSVLDQKGMLVECHYDDPVAFFVYTSSAVSFHFNLIKFVGEPESEDRKPVVMDKNPGSEVWNYVIVDYKITYKSAAGDPTKRDVTTKITYLNYGPCDSSYTGREKSTVIYTYWIKGDFENPSSGEWTGDSITKHPHFFWYPDYPKKEPGCPIDYNTVKEILKKEETS
jgi:hypothetical protein